MQNIKIVLEKLIVAQLVKKYLEFTKFTRARHWSLSSQHNSLKSIVILFSHLPPCTADV
jgi:hypothetical protein